MFEPVNNSTNLSENSNKRILLKVNPENISQIFFFLAIIFIFFPIRHVFLTSEAFQTGAYSDFTSISLYISDIFLVSAFLLILPRGIRMFFSNKSLILMVLWLLLLTLINFDSRTSMNWYFLVKYLEFFIVAYGTGAVLLQDVSFRTKFLILFLVLTTFESILGILQFIKQKSIGLKILGEQVIAPSIQGVAKVVVNGREYIRAYGTFPHPNLLSAFIFATLFFNIYLLFKSENKMAKIFLLMSLFINIFGLVLTFSRAAYLATFFSLLIYFGILLRKHLFNKRVGVIFILIFGGLLFAGVILRLFLLTRVTITDDASLERIFYAKIGIQILKTHPILGDGLGQSVLDMQKYSPIKLMPWQIQPIHNYFLLAAVEMGIIGALLLIIIFLLHVKQLLQSINQGREDDINFYILLLAIFAGFLILMQFDHYFYTIEQTQLLLWIVLGLISAEVARAYL